MSKKGPAEKVVRDIRPQMAVWRDPPALRPLIYFRARRIIRLNGEHHYFPNPWSRGFVLTEEEYQYLGESLQDRWENQQTFVLPVVIFVGVGILALIHWMKSSLIFDSDEELIGFIISALLLIIAGLFLFGTWTSRSKSLLKKYPKIFANKRRTQRRIPAMRFLLGMGLAQGGARVVVVAIVGVPLILLLGTVLVLSTGLPLWYIFWSGFMIFGELIVALMVYAMVRFRVRYGRLPRVDDLDMPLPPGAWF